MSQVLMAIQNVYVIISQARSIDSHIDCPMMCSTVYLLALAVSGPALAEFIPYKSVTLMLFQNDVIISSTFYSLNELGIKFCCHCNRRILRFPNFLIAMPLIGHQGTEGAILVEII